MVQQVQTEKEVRKFTTFVFRTCKNICTKYWKNTQKYPIFSCWFEKAWGKKC